MTFADYLLSAYMHAVDVGAMVEPLAVAWRAVKRAQISPGNSILLLGAGPVSYVPSVFTMMAK